VKPDANKQRHKRHHFVPQGYLKAWADGKDQVAVRNRGTDDWYPSNIKNVALESDLYTSYGLGGEPDDFLEKLLGDQIDGPAPALLSRLAEEKLPRRNSEDRISLSRFLAMQLVRTPDNIDQFMFVPSVLEYAKSPSGPVNFGLVREHLTHIRLGKVPSDTEVQAATYWVNGMLTKPGRMPSREQAIIGLFDIAEEHLAPALNEKAWSIEIDELGRFITADLPVSKYWYPGKRKMYMGVGIEDVDEVRFPIDPRHLLVMRRRYPENRSIASTERVRAVNQQIANRCYRQIIANRDHAQLLINVELQSRPLALRFNTGPLIREGIEGLEFEDGTVIQLYVEHPDD
jgi:hypothetical protein